MGIHQIPERTNKGRLRINGAINRIPSGYTIYHAGEGDNLATAQYGGGTELLLDKTNKIVQFQMLHHFYIIGGQINWFDGHVRDSIEGKLIGPKTEMTNGAGGDFTKVEIIPSSGLHVYVPTPAGAGDWNIDLTEKIGASSVLKCTPIPVAGNTGFFDYDADANELTINTEQKGGYNLYDFDANLFSFGRKIWGLQHGTFSLNAADVVGKLLYCNWKIQISLNIYDEANRDPNVGLILMTAAKKNI